MKRCKKCLNIIGETDSFCQYCGEPVEKEYPTSQDYLRKKEASQDYFRKKEAAQDRIIGMVPVEKSLWTWIRVGNGNKAIFDNENANVDNQTFVNKVSEKLYEKNVPATIRKADISWDVNKLKTEEYYFDISDSSVVNPFMMILQFLRVGKYAFVGDNLFIEPPTLPNYPRKKVPVPSNNGIGNILAGVGLFVLGMLVKPDGSDSMFYYSSSGLSSISALLVMAGIIVGCWGMYLFNSRSSAISNNAEADEERKRWNDAWDTWEKDNKEYVFQQIVNGRLDCIRQSILECVHLACDELFNEKPISEEKADLNQDALEASIARKKQLLE